MKQIKIVAICPIPDDPTSWYRGVGPLEHLRTMMPNLNIIYPQTVNWSTLKQADIVFLQRPCDPVHFQTLCIAKDLGKPVWCDFDDNNLAVPKDNPMFHQYNQMHIKEAIVKLARHCDLLTVATENLRKKYSIYNKNTFVVPNAIDECLLRHRALKTTPREKLVLWRGTPTHKRNLDSIKEEIISLANKHKDWKFGFMGFDPIDITDNIKNFMVCGANGPIETYKALPQIHATLGYYVLANNDHAQSRSHIAWLEYTFAGMPTVAIKNDEFTRPGITNFSNGQEFKDAIEAIITKQVDTEKLVEESWTHIQENYLLSKVNLARKHFTEQLAGVSNPSLSSS